MLSFEKEFTALTGALFTLSQSVDDPVLRRALGRTLTENVPKLVSSPPSAPNPLWTEGLISIGPMARRLDLRTILDRLSNCPLYTLQTDGQLTPPPDEFSLSERPNNVLFAGLKSEDVIRCTDLLKLACDPAVTDAVSWCIGCTPTISRFHAYYAFPRRTDLSAAAFRRDLDDFTCIKLLVYLTDVGPEDGPHQFVPYSHRFESLNQYLRSTGKKIDLQSLFKANSRNLVATELESLFAEDIVTLAGPAGSAFLVDGYGLYREPLPKPGSPARLVFSCLYSGLPLRFGDKNIRHHETRRTMSFSEAGLGDPSEVQRYMLRYYLSDPLVDYRAGES